MLCNIDDLENFAKFAIKHLCRSDFFNKLLPWCRPFYRTPAVIAFVGTLLQNELTHLIKDDYDSHMMTLREECPYSEFFWSVFSRIRTEKLRTRKTNQKNSEHGHFSPSVSDAKEMAFWKKAFLFKFHRFVFQQKRMQYYGEKCRWCHFWCFGVLHLWICI